MIDERGNGLPGRESSWDFSEKRREERYAVSAVYQRYITMKVKSGSDFMSVALSNFSRSGVLFVSPVLLPPDSRAECIISIPRLLSKDISFGILVRHCFDKENSFLVGASVETVADETWFAIFTEIHDFIMRRRDVVY
jgi:hypothetical protein